jgi:tRNA pseudouridine55 synthase
VNLPDRVLLVDKPVGVTSFDMVRRLRRGTQGRVGHAGTLDPFASGLLLLMTGRATRLSSLLMALPKEYEMTVQFGAASSTGDPTGHICPGGRRVSAEEVVAALDRFRGRVVQKVPLTSAVKVAGEPLYKRAHRGEEAETPEREVCIYDLTLTLFEPAKQQATIVALVGSGTYLRVLAADLGEALGSRAYAAALRRTRIGLFAVADAVSGERLAAPMLLETGRGILTLEEALSFLPRLDVDEQSARKAVNGNELRPFPAGRFRVHGCGGLVGVFEGRAGVGRPLVVLPPGG